MGILDQLHTPSCATCHWWSQEDGHTGHCRHSSPVGILCTETGGYYGHWPSTDASDWCGDHQYRGVPE